MSATATMPLLRVFQACAEARAFLLQCGEFPTWNDAFGPLLEWATVCGLAADVGQSALSAIVDRACADEGIEFEDGK